MLTLSNYCSIQAILIFTLCLNLGCASHTKRKGTTELSAAAFSAEEPDREYREYRESDINLIRGKDYWTSGKFWQYNGGTWHFSRPASEGRRNRLGMYIRQIIQVVPFSRYVMRFCFKASSNSDVNERNALLVTIRNEFRSEKRTDDLGRQWSYILDLHGRKNRFVSKFQRNFETGTIIDQDEVCPTGMQLVEMKFFTDISPLLTIYFQATQNQEGYRGTADISHITLKSVQPAIDSNDQMHDPQTIFKYSGESFDVEEGPYSHWVPKETQCILSADGGKLTLSNEEIGIRYQYDTGLNFISSMNLETVDNNLNFRAHDSNGDSVTLIEKN